MLHTQEKEIILIGCFSEGGKWGGTRTYVESLKEFLLSNNYKITHIPKSKKIKGSYSCLARIKIDSLRMKISPMTLAIAQRPDDLFMFQLFRKKNKSICVLHGDNLRKMELKRNKITARVYRIMEKQGLKAADSIICVDQSTYDIHLQKYPWLKEKTIIIPVGVNTEVFKPLNRTECRKKIGIPQDAKVMLVAARFEKEKNVKAVIELIKDYFDDKNHYLLIAGTGKEEQMLRGLAGRVKNAKITFLGQVQYEKLPEVICASNVVLVPSLFESGPLIIIEAMACGVPTVTTDVGRASIFIAATGCGAVVNGVNNEFAHKVKIFLEINNSIKEKCTERVKMFSFHNTGLETVKFIEELR